MSFKDMVEEDNAAVFLNLDEYADEHDISFDGNAYEAVPCVISKLKEKDRTIPTKDHAQGIYLVSSIFHCRAEDLDGNIPEKGRRFSICEDDFWRDYYVAQSSCDMGMVRLELEAMEE